MTKGAVVSTRIRPIQAVDVNTYFLVVLLARLKRLGVVAADARGAPPPLPLCAFPVWRLMRGCLCCPPSPPQGRTRDEMLAG